MAFTGATAVWVGLVALLCLTTLPPSMGEPGRNGASEWKGACYLIPCSYDFQCSNYHSNRGCGICGQNGTCVANTTQCGRNCSYNFECGGPCSNCTMGQCSPGHCGQRCYNGSGLSCREEGCTICSLESRCTSPTGICGALCNSSRNCRGPSNNVSSSVCPYCKNNQCRRDACGGRCVGNWDCGGSCSSCVGGRCSPQNPSPIPATPLPIPAAAPVAPSPSGPCGIPCNPFHPNCNGSCPHCLAKSVGSYTCQPGSPPTCGLPCNSSSVCSGACGHCTYVGGLQSQCLGNGSIGTCGKWCSGAWDCDPNNSKRSGGQGDYLNSSCPYCNMNLQRCTGSVCGKNCSTHYDCNGPGGCGYCDFGKCNTALTQQKVTYSKGFFQRVSEWFTWALSY